MTVAELRTSLEGHGYDWKWSEDKATLQGALLEFSDEKLDAPKSVGIASNPDEQFGVVEIALPPGGFWVASHAVNGPGLHGPASVFRTTLPTSSPSGGGTWISISKRPKWAEFV